ncbi:telomere-associated protein RIF1-like isoform X2 [Mytilus californianus]|uniref:telomere-associated protein RIF1-like isoform X2 n=1 Tax=Mytilus californianus TaxID=6549 RepID=UPI002248718F|nr:telomere-associated protein RIF1-like isoform X2 [Mytilus californianus]
MASTKSVDINLAAVVAILEHESSSHEDKADAYSQVTKHMKDDDLSLFDLDLSKHGKLVVTMAIRDILDSHPKVSHGALHVLGFCLHDKDIVRSLGYPLQTKCLIAIEKCIGKFCEDKIACTRALWCIGNQVLSDFIVKSELTKLIKAIGKVWNRWISKSATVENEASKAVIRLYQQDPEGMKENFGDWGKSTLLSLVHLVPQIGSQLLSIAREVFTKDNVILWSKPVLDEYKMAIGPELKKMMSEKQEVHALRLWSLYVHVLGKELHNGNFINQMLPLVEEGFKSINAEVKIEAFRAWKQLILNFSTDISILSDSKRIKLIMQVFKFNNAKTEPVAVEKFKIWWFFITKLGSKAAVYFDQVCLPLLNFCLGGSVKTSTSTGTPRMQTGISPMTPHLNLPSSSSGLPVFDKLQRNAWEVIGHFFGDFPSDLGGSSVKYQLESPKVEFLTGPPSFLKHSLPLITATIDILKFEFTTEAVLHHIWFALIAHIKNVLDSGITSDVKEMFSFFLTQFQTLVLSQALHLPKIWTMFDAVCCLPRKSLSSTAYNISNGEKIHGSPALFLMELLLTPSVLSRSQRSEKYMTIFSNLTSVGLENGTGYLEFCQSVLELLGRNREFIKEPDCIWRLWSRLANCLHDQITKTNEINQGDSLEHNFNCMYNMLTFPVKYKMTHAVEAPTYKTMVKTWTELYSTLSRLSALVTTAESNVCCEELCHIILKDIAKDCLLNLNGLDFVAQGCLAMINCMDFGSVGTVGNFNIGGISPAKWAKKKQKPLENLQSFVDLLCHLSVVFTELTEDFMSSPQKLRSLTRKIDGGSPNLTSILSTVFETIIILYAHITSSTFLVKLLEKTANTISGLYKLSSGWSGVPFIKKTEKMTETICNSVQKQYNGQLDSDFLKIMSPFVEATLSHPRRSISVITQNFWTNTFSTGPPLDYPESLSELLQSMTKKHRLRISLPNWVVNEVDVVDETPCSELTQGDSQAPEPHIPGIPSPHKICGSFLKKAVSPHREKSPAKSADKTPNSAKKKILPVDDFQNEVFVVIKSPPPKRNPLTEHQIEIFKEKRTVPAMYNTLDASQDISLMSHFNTGNSQSQSQLPKILPAKNSETLKQEKDKGEQSSQKSEVKKREPSIHGKRNKKKSSINDSDGTSKTNQRSVRFSDEINIDATSPDASQKDIAHFNVIKSMLPNLASKGTPTKQNENLSDDHQSLMGREEDEISCVQQLMSLGTPRLSPPGKSSQSDSPCKEEGLPSPSQRRLDSWIIKSPIKQSELSNFRQEKMSESGSNAKKTKGKKSAHVFSSPRVQTRRSSIENGKKDDMVVHRKVSEDSQTSNKLLSSQEKMFSQTSLSISLVDETQSPKKMKPPNDDAVFVKPTTDMREKMNDKTKICKLSPVIAVIEETQSPKKSTGFNPILTTPPKLVNQEDLDFCEDSNIIPASPTSNKSVRLGTPVLKLRKLTQNEILQYSPSRKDGTSSSLTPTRRRGRPCKSTSLTPCSSDPSSNRSGDKELAQLFLHEHDDFSDLKPIQPEQIEDPAQNEDLPASQGFSVEQSGSKQASLSASESLFTERDSQEYNPCLESTLSETTTKVEKYVKSVDKSPPAVIEKDTCESTHESDPGSYNPLLEPTLATSTIGSARKRKQKTPKKLSPESAGPPRRKRRHISLTSKKEENSSQDDSGMDGQNLSDSVSTPKRRRVMRGKNHSEVNNPVANGKKAEKEDGKSETKILLTSQSEKSSESSQINSLRNEESQALISLEECLQNSSSKSVNDNIITVGHVQIDNTNINEQSQIFKQKKSGELPVETDNFMDVDFNESFTEDAETGQIHLKINKTPESDSTNKQKMEKTPENRSITDTPTRVSTTKKKKEVAQRRSLTKGKTAIPLDLDTKLDTDDSKDTFKTRNKELESIIESEVQESEDIFKSIKENLTEEVNEISDKIKQNKQTIEAIDIEDVQASIKEDQKNVPEADKNSDKFSGETIKSSELKADKILGDQGSNNQSSCDQQDKNESSVDQEDSKKTSGNQEFGNKSSSSQDDRKQSSENFELFENSENKELENNIEQVYTDEFNSGEKRNNQDKKDDSQSKNIDAQKECIDNQQENDNNGTINSSNTNVCSENKNNKSEENLDTSLMSTSFTSESDDNVPLSSLKPKDISPTSDLENFSEPEGLPNKSRKGRPKKITGDGKGKTSPLSQRLRSSGRTLRTRGIKKAASDMLSLSKSKRTKRNNVDTTQIEEEKDGKGALSELTTEANDVIVIPSQSQSTSVKIDEAEEIVGPDNLKKFNDMMQDETPRKTPDVINTRKGLTFADRHSDSKLITVSRKFEKRSIMARRSILKPTIRSLSLESPSQRKSFHPIKIGHIYSPSASPSAGILKRRRLSGEKAKDSPSPPPKQRRVSFATPLSESKQMNGTTERPASPLVSTSTSKVSSSLEKIFTSSVSDSQVTDSDLSKKDSEMSQSSYASTQQSQLNTSDAVFPELKSCAVSVDKVLPQLTSSMWARGLGQLVKARNIHTIGDLSSLTEKQVDELPIRSPKVSVVRKVLRKYEEQTGAKQIKIISAQEKQGNAKEEQNIDKTDIQVSSTDLQKNQADSKVSTTDLQNDQSNSKVSTTDLQNDQSDSKVSTTDLQKDQADSKVSTTDLQKNQADSKVSTADLENDQAESKVSKADLENDQAENKVSKADISIEQKDDKSTVDNTDSKTQTGDISISTLDKADIEIQTILHSSDKIVPHTDDMNTMVSTSVSEGTSSELKIDPEEKTVDKNSMISTLQSLVEQCKNDNMKELKTQDIFKIHQHLSELTTSVVDTLKQRCHSPTEN